MVFLGILFLIVLGFLFLGWASVLNDDTPMTAKKALGILVFIAAGLALWYYAGWWFFTHYDVVKEPVEGGTLT